MSGDQKLSRRTFLAGAVSAGVALAVRPDAIAARSSGRLIVDAQAHVWLPNTPDHPWVSKDANALMGSVAERHPGLTMLVDHMGVSEAFMRSTPNWQDEVTVVAGLAKYPNVSVKLSSIPFLSSQPYPWRDTIPLIHRCFDAFGPQRCHWGSDLSHSFEKATFSQRITQFTEELPFLSESDKDWIMGRSLLARLRW